ncbi:MAG: DUF4349 domain-containing protein [Nanoarchaeota archaeon]
MKPSFYQRHKTAVIVVAVIAVLFIAAQFINNSSFSAGSDTYDQSFNSKATRGARMMAPSMAPSPMETSFDEESSGGAEISLPPENRKLQKTARVDYETSDYGAGKQALENLASAYNGYYTSKDESKETVGDRDYKTFSIQIKVPVASFENAVNDLKRIDGLKSLSVEASDRTDEYADAKAYYDNYVAERDRLKTYFNRSNDVGDLAKLENALVELQIKIDRLGAQLKNIDRVTEYSTIYAQLSEKKEIKESFYEMTKGSVLWANVLTSIDSVIVILSLLSGWIVVALLVWLGYKGVKRLTS